MGGSGGGFFSGKVDPAQLARQTRKAEEVSRNEGFETQVGEFLATELSTYNDRNVDKAQAVFDALTDDLKTEVEGLLFGGSISKHTYVDGLSDIDALVIMNRSELRNASPKEVQRLIAESLRARYGRDAVVIGQLAVTLASGKDIMQFLPALRQGAKFRIASSDGNSWAEINPEGFAKALTRANQAMDGKLVPCIKIAKAIISKLPEQRRLTGYHTESLAIEVFKNYNGPKTTANMVRHFFENAPDRIKTPIVDSSGQSVHVDEYLGAAHSLERRTVADAIGRISRRIRNADGAGSLDGWRELLE